MEKDSTVYKAAKEALSGVDPTNGALYFYNPKTAKSKWLFSLKTVATIGNHRFAVEEWYDGKIWEENNMAKKQNK